MPELYAHSLRFLGDTWILSFVPEAHPTWTLPSVPVPTQPPRITHHSPESLRPLVDTYWDTPPAAFIFHVGRCGSTWLGRLLDEHKHVRVLFEPRYLVDFAAGSYLRDLNSLWFAEQIRPLIALTHLGCPAGVRPIIKWPSHALLMAPRLRDLYPTVPQILVIREPVEVLAALVHDPPGFITAPPSPWVARCVDGIREASDFETICGIYLRWLMGQAARNVDGFDQVLDYTDLPTAANKLLQRAGFDSPLDARQIESAGRRHSKKRDQDFQTDSERKRASTSEYMRTSANEIRNSCYLPCLAKRRNKKAPG